MIKQTIHQRTVLKNDLKRVVLKLKHSRRVKLNNETPFYRKILTVFAHNADSKELRNYKWKLIWVRHKSRRKHNQHFKTAAFHNKFTLCQIKPNIYIQKTKFASYKQYLVCVLTCRNAKETWTNQSIPLVFLLCLKRNDPQPLKVAAAQNPFIQCVRYWYNLLRECFFFWKTFLFVNVYRYSEIFKAPCCCFLWSKCFARSPYFMHYPTITIWY